MKTTEMQGDQGGEWKVLAELLGIDGPGGTAAQKQSVNPAEKMGPVLVKSPRVAEGNSSWLDRARIESGSNEGSRGEILADAPTTPEVQAGDKQALLDRGWAALPESYRMPKVAPTVEEAQAWCKNLAETHYENFHVASWFLPKALRPHFHAIYAYCRVSDDLGDEVGDPQVALAMLDMWGEELDGCYAGEARHPVFVALGETIKACAIPREPFADLLIAFRHDQMVTRYETMDEVLEYCRYSANPVGRLVLYATGEAESDRDEKFRLSDATCTALQLANFWQDVREDWGRGRLYIPLKDMKVFRVTEATIAEGIATDQFRGLLRTEVDYARELFKEGLPLIGMVNRELAIDLDLFSRGGLEILRAIEERQYDVLSERPSIAKSRKAGLALRAVAAKLLPFMSLGAGRRREPAH
jgi:squalene synthase HpnC